MTARSYIAFVSVLVLAGCTSLQLDAPTAASPVWVTEGATTLRDNAVPDRVPPPLEQRWDFNAGAGFGNVSPLIIGDVILVATRKGEVHAIDLESGRRVGQGDFGDSIEGTPVYDRGLLVVPVAWGGVALHAHDLLLGARRWRVKGPPVHAGLVARNGSVIAGDVEGSLRAYDLTSGKELWSTQLSDRSGIYSTPVLVGDRLVAANDDGLVAAFDVDDGSLLWSVDVEAPVQVSLAANDQAVFAATTRGRIWALDLHTGAVVWDVDLSRHDVYLSAPAVGDGEVVFGASDGIVRSVDVNHGSQRWTADVSAAVTASPLITQTAVYVGTMGGKLLALGRDDGSKLWETELEGRVKSAFAVWDGRLVVLAEPRDVHLFEPSPESYAIRER